MKRRRNSFLQKNNETDLFGLIDIKFKKKIMKILKNLRIISGNENYCKKYLKSLRKSQ